MAKVRQDSEVGRMFFPKVREEFPYTCKGILQTQVATIETQAAMLRMQPAIVETQLAIQELNVCGATYNLLNIEIPNKQSGAERALRRKKLLKPS